MKNERVELGLAWAVFAAVVAYGFYFLFLGVSVADESLYLVLGDFPRMGSKWFVDDLTIQTTGAILIAPFISTYTSIFGTEGVALFSRILYLLSATGSALVLSRLLRRICRPSTAILLASVYVAYVPFGMAILYYNTMGSQGFLVGSVLTLLGWTEKRPWLLFWGGFVWVLCVFSYPTSLITFFVFSGIAIKLWHREMTLVRLKPFLAGLVIPSVVLFGILFWCGVGNILKAAELSNNFNLPFQPFKLLLGSILIAAYLPPWWIVVPILLAWVWMIFKRPQYSQAGLVLFLMSYIFLGGRGEGTPMPIFWPVTESLIVLVVWQYWREFSPFLKSSVRLIVIPAIVGSLVSWATSRMTVYNMHGTGITAALTTLALASRQHFAVGWLVAALTLGYTLSEKRPYEDDAAEKLIHRVSAGPFKYLYTNHDKWKTIEQLQKDLAIMPQQGTILFKDTFPAGYLMTGLRPVGPMINVLPAFLHPEARPIFYKLYENRQYFTEFVVEFRWFPMSNEDWVYMDDDPESPKDEWFIYDPFHNFFMRTGEYKVILDRGVYRILHHSNKRTE